MSWFARLLRRRETPAPLPEMPRAFSLDPDRDELQDRKIENLQNENLVLKAHLDALERIVLKRAGG